MGLDNYKELKNLHQVWGGVKWYKQNMEKVARLSEH